MEILFTWLSDSFNLSTTAGFGAIGVSLSGLFIIMYSLYWLGLWLWCFVEDAKLRDKAVKYLLKEKHDIMQRQYSVYRLENADDWYEHENHYYPKGSKIYVLSGWCGMLPPIVISGLCFGGLLLGAIIQGIMFLPVLSSVVISVFLAVFGARGIRRLQKKLNTHLLDANAHSKDKGDEATT